MERIKSGICLAQNHSILHYDGKAINVHFKDWALMTAPKTYNKNKINNEAFTGSPGGRLAISIPT
jgi:hypothetical protein